VSEAGAKRRYDPRTIEHRWRERWAETDLYKRDNHPQKLKHYALTMLPYPSGDLHVGHWYAMTPSDTRARFMRMRGYRVFFPIGFDAFGLPAENAAINRGIHPYKWTMSNIETMRGQLKQMGTMFDFDSEIITCVPEYYRWNQWFFLKFLEKGLAYRKEAQVDWCPKDNTTLAREQVIGADRRCERCGTPVVKKNLAQWLFKITGYAEELLGFSGVEWPERVKTLQTNWIGRSEGAEILFDIPGFGPIEVFTTRPDTVFGATFFVIAPEHPAVEKIMTPEHADEVGAYVERAGRMTEIDRMDTTREKTGVFTGACAVNPANGQEIPIYVADYVLLAYGTGAIMAVPAHDERDYEFAKKHGIEVRTVIAQPHPGEELEEVYTGEGIMVNSGPFNGTPNTKGKAAVTSWLEEMGLGRAAVTYRLRDWLISRQRYWGTPIPIVYCRDCGIVPVPEEDLPVLLPEDAEFMPTGESPLKLHEGFRNTTCPRCGSPAERETDTMDTFVDSSWYQYRYLSPHYGEGPFDPAEGELWLPVDQYTGGIEHATMHLLYTRFFTKVMRDLGLVDFDEPMIRLFNQGIILGEDAEKMSKSRGNVVNPQEFVDRYGSDALRCYLMFLGPWNQGGPWDARGIEGVARFLRRVHSLASPESGSSGAEADPKELDRRSARLVKKATEDLEEFRFNTALAALMEHSNYLLAVRGEVGEEVWTEALRTFILVLAPFAPHHAEDTWALMGMPYSVHEQAWPSWDEGLIMQEKITLVVQVNGKLRDRIEAPADVSEDIARELALASAKVRPYVEGHEIRKSVYVPGRLLNFVVS